jgi:hypothetical protein
VASVFRNSRFVLNVAHVTHTPSVDNSPTRNVMVNAWFREALISLFSVATVTHRQASKIRNGSFGGARHSIALCKHRFSLIGQLAPRARYAKDALLMIF